MDRLAYHEIDKLTRYSQTKEIVKSKPKYDDLWDRCFKLENFYEELKSLIKNTLHDCDEYNCCGFSGKTKSDILKLLKSIEED